MGLRIFIGKQRGYEDVLDEQAILFDSVTDKELKTGTFALFRQPRRLLCKTSLWPLGAKQAWSE